MRTKLAVIVLVGLVITLATCDSGRPALGTSSRATTDPFDPMYDGVQGVPLEGGGDQEGRRLRFEFRTATLPNGDGFDQPVSLDGGTGTEFVGVYQGTQLRGSQFVGVTFTGTGIDGGVYTAKITKYGDHMDPHDPNPPSMNLSEYQVQLDGAPFCNRAMPIEGSWTGDGLHLFNDDPPTFTFACQDGVMFKCIDFGWRPWVD